MKQATLFFDGASRGNPGLSGAGAVIKIGSDLHKYNKALGHGTNNEAEYQAIILGLEKLADFKKEIDTVLIKGDSQLIINQLTQDWRVNSSNLVPLHSKALSYIIDLSEEGINVDFQYIPREQNSEADNQANLALDKNR